MVCLHSELHDERQLHDHTARKRADHGSSGRKHAPERCGDRRLRHGLAGQPALHGPLLAPLLQAHPPVHSLRRGARKHCVLRHGILAGYRRHRRADSGQGVVRHRGRRRHHVRLRHRPLVLRSGHGEGDGRTHPRGLCRTDPGPRPLVPQPDVLAALLARDPAGRVDDHLCSALRRRRHEVLPVPERVLCDGWRDGPQPPHRVGGQRGGTFCHQASEHVAVHGSVVCGLHLPDFPAGELGGRGPADPHTGVPLLQQARRLHRLFAGARRHAPRGDGWAAPRARH
mmetsp:Transcript_89488/g.278491  ORF Transcript_89488/g.278491 Transcript_89488/m.278491 type:complete len:284 (-) Transcript_89488:698-1549(-)